MVKRQIAVSPANDRLAVRMAERLTLIAATVSKKCIALTLCRIMIICFPQGCSEDLEVNKTGASSKPAHSISPSLIILAKYTGSIRQPGPIERQEPAGTVMPAMILNTAVESQFISSSEMMPINSLNLGSVSAVTSRLLLIP